MKKALFFLLLVLTWQTTAIAQSADTKPHRVYWFASLGVAHPLALRGAVEIVSGKGMSCSLFGFSTGRHSANTPANYRGFDPFGSGTSVYETLQMVGVTVGKAWWSADNNYIRFHLKGGLDVGTFRYPVNFRPLTIYIFENYTYEWEERHLVGLVLQPTVKFALSRSFGLSLSLFAHFNKYRTMAGAEAAISFGHLRDKRPQKK